MKSTLVYRDGHLCILNESGIGAGGPSGAFGTIREWYAVREAAEAEVATLVGRPVKGVESDEGLYVDEDGNPYQFEQRGSSKPLAVKITPLATETARSGSDTAVAESDSRASPPETSAVDSSANRRPANHDRIRPKALMRKGRGRARAAAEASRNGQGRGVEGSVELPLSPTGARPPEPLSPKTLPHQVPRS